MDGILNGANAEAPFAGGEWVLVSFAVLKLELGSELKQLAVEDGERLVAWGFVGNLRGVSFRGFTDFVEG